MSDSSIAPPPPPITKPQFSKLNTSLWILFTVAASVGVLQSILTLARGAQYVNLDSGITPSKKDAAETMDNLIAAAIGLNMWIAVAIFVLLIVYTYRLVVKTRNAGFKVRMPNGLAIGAWFIPLANSILCLLFFVDIVKANPSNRQRGLTLLNLWWWLFIAGTHSIFLFESLVDDAEYYLDAGYLSYVGAGMTFLAVASAFFAVLFFRQIRHFEATLDKPANPPVI